MKLHLSIAATFLAFGVGFGLWAGASGAILAAARETGPLPTSEFQWLKGVDRPLFYALNNLGRRTFHVEGLAAAAHYRAEVAAGKRLPEPAVEDAARTVRHGLGFVPIVWIRNLPGGDEIDGACTFRPAIVT